MSTSAQTLQGPFGWAKLHGEKYVGQVPRHGRADRPSAHAEKLPYDAIFSGVHFFVTTAMGPSIITSKPVVRPPCMPRTRRDIAVAIGCGGITVRAELSAPLCCEVMSLHRPSSRRIV